MEGTDEEFPAPVLEKCLVCFSVKVSEGPEWTFDLRSAYLILDEKMDKRKGKAGEARVKLCGGCGELMEQAWKVLTELEDLRRLLKTKMETRDQGVKDDGAEIIEGDKKERSKSLKRKPGRPKRQGKNDQPSSNIVLPDPKPHLESPVMRTSKAGRVIKTPKRLEYKREVDEAVDSDDFDEPEPIDVKVKLEPDDFIISGEEQEDESTEEHDEDEEDQEESSDDSEAEIVTKKRAKGTGKTNKVKKSVKSRSLEGVNIKVIGPDGEVLDGIYSQGDINAETEDATPLKEGEFVEITSVLTDIDFPGVRVRCRDKSCKSFFVRLHKMNIHYRKVHEGSGEPYDCLECDDKFQTVRQLRIHAKEKHGNDEETPRWMLELEKAHRCSFGGCQLSFRTLGEMEIHLRNHTGEKPFQCSSCDESFVSVLKKETHIEQQHPEIPPLRCELCSKGFFRETRLKDHARSHTNERSYICEVCATSFTQHIYLRYHQTKHPELQLEPFKCKQCDRTFSSPVNLKIHTKTQHLNQYRYHCKICNHGAQHQSHLRLHMLTHSGERPHKCPTCSHTFTRASQLKIHVRSHTGERPYKCWCGKGFTNSSKLRRHESIHSQTTKFNCNICSKGFNQTDNLKSHMAAVHGVKGKSHKKKQKTGGKGKESSEQVEVTVHQEVESNTVFTPQVFSTNFSTVPLQVQVVTDDMVADDSQYAEFIIINHV